MLYFILGQCKIKNFLISINNNNFFRNIAVASNSLSIRAVKFYINEVITDTNAQSLLSPKGYYYDGSTNQACASGI